MSKIFFDLDGTLIYAQERLYRLFQQLVPQSNLGLDEYWALKRAQKGHAAILKEVFGWEAVAIKDFEEQWLALIEEPAWLALDRPLAGVEEVLRSLQGKYECYVVTARQFEDRAVAQVEGFGWGALFHQIFVTGRGREKYETLHGAIDAGPGDWYAGDTGLDIRTGKRFGMTTVAVLSGFRSRAALEAYAPDYIVEDVRALPALLHAGA